MHPVLFTIPLFGGIPIATYGALVAIAFFVGMLWVKYEARRVGADPEKALDLLFYIIIAAIVGSRVLHILVADLDRFLANPLILFKFWEGGLVFYGGFLASLAVGFWFVWKHRLPALLYCDIFTLPLPLGHAIGRIGCFFAGCCHGRPTPGHPWYAVVFPDVARSSAPAGIPLYPTQLMESAGEFSIFLLLLLVRSRKRFDGQIFATYLMAYAVLRSTIETFRGDIERGFVIDPWLSTSQFISIMIFSVGLVLFLFGRRRRADV